MHSCGSFEADRVGDGRAGESIVNVLSELERWRERQLDEYRHAQIIDRMDQQRLLDEYRRAQAIDRMDEQNAALSRLGSILADTGRSVGLIQSDIARLLAVTDRALPIIVDYLALVSHRLGGIEQMLASPRETEAWELFRSGSRALASAIEMSEKGSPGLSSDWLDEAISDLSRAVGIYPHGPGFWFSLGMAYARHGSFENAANSFSRCSRYAVSASPDLAAGSLLLAAGQLRRIAQHDTARDLLHKFLPPLERCAELHMALAKHHGESDQLTRALELDPLLAAAARAEGVASVKTAAAEVCRHEDGPVARLRRLEEAIQALVEASRGIGLDCANNAVVAVALPDFGVDALLKAEVSIQLVAEQGRRLASDVRSGLDRLEAHAQECLRQCQLARASGDEQVKDAEEKAARAKERAQKIFEAPLVKAMQEKESAEHAHRLAEEEFRRATSNAVAPQRTLEAYARVYESGEIRPDVLEELRGAWKTRVNWRHFDDGDDYYLFSWYEARNSRWLEGAQEWARKNGRSWNHVLNLVLLVVGEKGDKIRAEWEDARQAVENASASVRAAHQLVGRHTDIVEQVRQRQVTSKAREQLRRAEQEADRAYQRVLGQVEESVERARLESESAREVSRHATEVIAGFLLMLESTIDSSTASRDRIIPRAYLKLSDVTR